MPNDRKMNNIPELKIEREAIFLAGWGADSINPRANAWLDRARRDYFHTLDQQGHEAYFTTVEREVAGIAQTTFLTR